MEGGRGGEGVEGEGAGVVKGEEFERRWGSVELTWYLDLGSSRA